MARDGFTLVEVLVALVLAAIGVSTAVGVFGNMSDTISRLESDSRGWTRRANAAEWIREALTSARVDPQRHLIFDGDRNTIHFHASRRTPDGWVVPTDVEMLSHGGSLRARNSTTPALLLIDSLSDASFAYLLGTGSQAAWLPEWRSETQLPVAIRLVLTHAGQDLRSDTSVFLVGGGG